MSATRSGKGSYTAVAAHEPTPLQQDFLARMSHELRTPLTAILGYADMLSEDKAEDDPDQEDLRGIRRATQRLIGLVESVLDLSQLQEGRFRMAVEDVDLQAIAHETQRRVDELAVRHSNEVIVAAEPLTVRGDPRVFRQILFNLAENACRFTQRGTVTITIQSVSGVLYRLRVEDDGIGMTQAQMDASTQAFWQADSSSTRRYDGAGVGLAVCRGMVEAMGGNLSIRSSPGQGATVDALIPRHLPESEEWDDDEPTLLLR